MDPGTVYPHRIRLRGPWEWYPLTPGPEPRRLTMPCRWRDAGLVYSGPAKLVRSFGYPGRIDDIERVWLLAQHVAGAAEVLLNGQNLGTTCDGPFAFDVTSLLSSRNRLEICIDSPDGSGGLPGEVALEIRRTAYLRNVRLEGRKLQGELVGQSERPLELYVLVGGKTMDYQTLEPTQEGRPFDVPFEAFPDEGASIRVELIDGAVVWYRLDLEIPGAAV